MVAIVAAYPCSQHVLQVIGACCVLLALQVAGRRGTAARQWCSWCADLKWLQLSGQIWAGSWQGQQARQPAGVMLHNLCALNAAHAPTLLMISSCVQESCSCFTYVS